MFAIWSSCMSALGLGQGAATDPQAPASDMRRRSRPPAQAGSQQQQPQQPQPPAPEPPALLDPDALFVRSRQARLRPRRAAPPAARADADAELELAKARGNKLFADRLYGQAALEYSTAIALFAEADSPLLDPPPAVPTAAADTDAADPAAAAAADSAARRLSKRWSLNAKRSLSDLRDRLSRKSSNSALSRAAKSASFSAPSPSATSSSLSSSAASHRASWPSMPLPPSPTSSLRSPATPPAPEPPALYWPTAETDLARFGSADDRNMLAMLLSNRAAAFVAAGAFSDGLLDAMATIRWRPDWVKGYFRKAEALWGLGQFSLALDAYEVAHAVDPTNRTIVDRIHRTRGRILDDATGLAIHQLFPGRDICKKSILAPVQNLVFDYAIRMRNFIYLVANTYSRECVVVDACWDVDGILSFAKSKGLRIVAAVVTHYHIDHVGGIPPAPFDSYGVRVDGLAKLLRKLPDIKAYAHHNDIDAIIKTNPEMTRDRFVPTENGSSLTLPLIEKGVPSLVERVAPDSLETTIGTHVTSFTFMHTPGHTPGSQCILVNGCRLFSGDTLFIGSCGRVDSPDSSSSDLYDSLQRTLAALPDSVLVYPGHDYGGEMTTIGEERQTGLLREIHRTVFMSQFDQ